MKDDQLYSSLSTTSLGGLYSMVCYIFPEKICTIYLQILSTLICNVLYYRKEFRNLGVKELRGQSYFTIYKPSSRALISPLSKPLAISFLVLCRRQKKRGQSSFIIYKPSSRASISPLSKPLAISFLVLQKKRRKGVNHILLYINLLQEP